MKKVDQISLNNARNGEHFDFMSTAIGIFTATRAEAFNLTQYYSTFKAIFDDEDIAIKIIRGSENTAAIQQLDRERDDIFIFLYHTIEMSTKLPDVQIKQAADQLYVLMRSYKGINQKTQRDKSGLYTNLTTDLQSSAYTTAITRLNLTATVTQLKQKNEVFIEIYLYRADEAEQKKAIAKMATLRPIIDEAYNNCMQMLNAVYAANEVQPTPDPVIRTTGEQMINALQANVLQMKLILDTRRHRAENKKKNDPPEPISPSAQ